MPITLFIFILLGLCIYILFVRYYRQKLTNPRIQSLSQLADRRAFLEIATPLMTQKKEITFIIISLDHLKLLNATLGCALVDQLLQQFSQRVTHYLQQHTLHDYSLFRITGDEFLILAPSIEKTHIQKLSADILRLTNSPFQLNEQHQAIYLTVSIGIAYNHQLSLQALLHQAEQAVLKAKEKGRNTFIEFDETQTDAHYPFEQLAIFNDLYTAHQNQQLCVHYQPKYNLSSLKIQGVEALLRWNHPTQGLLYPKDFIQLAEKTGQIIPINYWVIEHCFQQAHLWQQANKTQLLPISINISGLVFEQPQFLDKVIALFQHYQLQPNEIIFEITETTALQNLQHCKHLCHQLHQLGIKLAIDDFGMGYANFIYLRNLTFDELKIDRAFLKDLMSDPSSTSNEEHKRLLSNIIHLAQDLQLTTTIEGIETLEQLQLLQSLDCHMAQGFYLSRPMSAQDVERILN